MKFDAPTEAKSKLKEIAVKRRGSDYAANFALLDSSNNTSNISNELVKAA